MRAIGQPKASSSADSSGVPQTRQMTAEQSPQVSGSCTGRAQTGHQRAGAAAPGTAELGGALSMCLQPSRAEKGRERSIAGVPCRYLRLTLGKKGSERDE